MALETVVSYGTGRNAYIEGYRIGGKTGTAQKESETYGDYDHTWFAGWAENNEQKLAVCVILENMEASGMTASYISKLIFDYYFGY